MSKKPVGNWATLTFNSLAFLRSLIGQCEPPAPLQLEFRCNAQKLPGNLLRSCHGCGNISAQHHTEFVAMASRIIQISGLQFI